MSPVPAEFDSIPFQSRNVAAQNLERLARMAPPQVTATLLPLLADSPDPDIALNYVERLLQENPQIGAVLARNPALVHYSAVIFGESDWLGETLVRNPDLLQSALARERSMGTTHSAEDFAQDLARFQSRGAEMDKAAVLAQFKRRQYVRIALRDALGIATLAETTGEISALADAIIAEALRYSEIALLNRYGPPQHADADGRIVPTPFAVFALGKLGGNELNYSSDVDLLYVYGDGAELPSARITNREYFVRLAQEITALLSRVTPHGITYRIDLRLRPQGREGEPAVAFRYAADYYEHRAGDWERQALIKARHCAGDEKLARAFIRRVQPFVYTEHVNFSAIETALAARERIGAHRRGSIQKGGALDVKLDRGGIRDIEFLVQCLQRVYGGSEPWLRSGGTLFSLQKLHDKQHISGSDFQQLTSAYELLRATEHRLQLRRGQQTHTLPTDARALQRLARSLAPRFVAQPQPEALVAALREHMAAVAAIYARIVHQEQRVETSREALVPPGREELQRQVIERLAVDSPALHGFAIAADFAPHTRKNFFRFLNSALTDAQRYEAVIRVPEAAEKAVRIFATSEFLTDILVRYPEEIAALRDGAKAVASHAWQGASRAEALTSIRRFYRTSVFLSGARDVLEPRAVFASLEETTRAADEAIAAAVAVSEAPPGFAVLGLGRLGTNEHDFLSDADLIFVRDESLAAHAASRAAGGVVEALSAYTREGTVFAVDTRLRPHGQQGELVVTPGHLREYFRRDAKAWEAVTWTKLRFVAGVPGLGAEVNDAAGVLFARFAADPSFMASLRDMRERLIAADEEGSLKSAAGAMYDIDFVSSALLVRHGLRGAGNTRERLQMLAQAGALSAEDFATLDGAAELYRATEHAIRLATGAARKTLPVAGPARAAVEELVRGMVGRGLDKGLELALGRAFCAVRETYVRLFA